MKNLLFIALTIIFLIGCSASKNVSSNKSPDNTSKASDTVRIANDDLQYEVIIIDGGFHSWLISQAKPRGYYSESFLEGRNIIYVSEWNNRFLQPQNYNNNLYEMQINYDPTIHYGYEVNYLIYNYMIYFQLTYKQQLAGFVVKP